MEENKIPEDGQSSASSAPVATQEETTQEVKETSEESHPQAAVSSTPVNVATAEKKDKEGSDSDDDDDDEDVIEESPCGRYIKRREVVKYRDVPGIGNTLWFFCHYLVKEWLF